MTTHKNEYLQQIEDLILETRQRLDAQRTANQDKIDALAARIEALEHQLLPLPGHAKVLRAQGEVMEAHKVIEQVESLNIRIAKLRVEQAQLEADRLEGFSGTFRAIFPQVNQLVNESVRAGEEEKRRIEQERVIALNLAGHPAIYEQQYAGEAIQAQERLNQARIRLNRAVNGSGAATAA